LERFKQIFRDWFQEFLRQYPEYERTREVVQKILGCGDKEQGYSEFLAPSATKSETSYSSWKDEGG
jgi:hypothetical protein